MPHPLLHYPLNNLPASGAQGLSTDGKPTLETPFFAVKQQSTLYVYRNHCPHLGLPLEWMPDQFLERDNCYIQCATHGALFNIHDGLCVSGPCKGEKLEAIPFTTDEITASKNIIMIDESFLTKENKNTC